MSFQKCPRCDGTWYIYPHWTSNATSTVCPVCNGAMIISELTWLPPKKLTIAISKWENVGKISNL